MNAGPWVGLLVTWCSPALGTQDHLVESLSMGSLCATRPLEERAGVSSGLFLWKTPRGHPGVECVEPAMCLGRALRGCRCCAAGSQRGRSRSKGSCGPGASGGEFPLLLRQEPSVHLLAVNGLFVSNW